MNICLVGGAVRDELLGLPVTERDWVVTGATPEDMLRLGYRPVGKDFPVFLHPDNGEEYALARTERKTAPGYHGFVFHTDPSVTLEADLQRRDFTINAMARCETGELIDPFNGRADIEARLLRHVSPAFAEDPVRILRAARFAARFASLGFKVAPETMQLMRQMAASGEVDALVPERVWQETARALASERPSVFFEVLRDCDALTRVFPELARLFGVPQPPRHHPEIDTGVHTMMVVDQAARLSAELSVRFAALTHDLGKGTTSPERLPHHYGHESRSVELILQMCERLKVPRECRDLAVIVAREHGKVHRADELRPATLLKLLESTDAFRRPERFELFLLACEADARGRKGLEDAAYPQAGILRAALAAAQSVKLAGQKMQAMDGTQIATALHNARLEAIRKL